MVYPIKKLSEICLIWPKKSEVSKLNWDTLVSFVPMKDVQKWKRFFYPLEEKKLWEIYNWYTYFKDEDIILAKVTPCFENWKSWIAKNLKNWIWFWSSEFYVFRCSDEIIPEWLYCIISSEIFLKEWADNMSWAVWLQRVTKDFISNYPIPLPALSTQQKIVSKLDASFVNLNSQIDLLKQNIFNIEELNKSVLEKVFSEWEYEKAIFWKVCNFVRWPFGWSLKKEIFKKSWYVVYEQMHAIWDQYEKIRYYIDEQKFNEMKRFELKSWNLIMSCSGTMWKVSIVPEWIKKWIINQALLALKPNEKLLNKYLKLYMESGVFQDEISKYSKWAAIKNVASVKILKEIQIPLPPLQTQKEIVAYLDQVFEKNKTMKQGFEGQIQALEELKQSLLKDAFEGRLVQN